MADNESAFVQVFRAEMRSAARAALTDDVMWVRGSYGSEARKDAEELVSSLSDEKVMDLLRAMEPEPCSECGRA